MTNVTLEIEGMSCSHCLRAVDEAIREVPGVIDATVQLGSATVTVDPTVRAEQLVDAVQDAGYAATVHSDVGSP